MEIFSPDVHLHTIVSIDSIDSIDSIVDKEKEKENEKEIEKEKETEKEKEKEKYSLYRERVFLPILFFFLFHKNAPQHGRKHKKC